MLNIANFAEQHKNSPLPTEIFRGLFLNGINYIIGSPGVGKSTLGESLALHLANKAPEFLREKLYVSDSRIALISLEESDQPRIRRDRLEAQTTSSGLSLNCPIFLNSQEEIPPYFNDDEHWDILENKIRKWNINIVIVDSLTRLFTGTIENSKEVNDFMSRLKAMRERLGVTFIIIHHVTKQPMDIPLDISKMGGSRVVAQEASGVLGINRLSDDTIYLKDLKSRYSPTSMDVTVVKRVDKFAFEYVEHNKESNLIAKATNLSKPDGRANPKIRKEFIQKILESPEAIQKFSILKEFGFGLGYKESSIKSILAKMVNEGLLEKPDTGMYKVTQEGDKFIQPRVTSKKP